jgi:hypothetical protein
MSKFKRRPDGTTYRKRNPISEQFSARTRAMLESPAYRVMSLAAHRVDRSTRDALPPNDWQKVKTTEEAGQIARAARAAKDKRAEAFGHRSWGIRIARTKTEANTGKRAISTPE